MAISRSPVVKTSNTQSSLPCSPQCSQAFSAASSSTDDDSERRRRKVLVASLVVGSHGALRLILRETNSLKERGLGVKDLPFLAKRIHIVEHGFTVTGKPAPFSKVAHQSDAIAKVLTQTLFNQDRDEMLVSLELDALASFQMHYKDKNSNPDNSLGSSALATPLR